MDRWMRTALVTAGLNLWAISSASAQVAFKIDAAIPSSIARELKRHGIEVPTERVRGTLEIRHTARDGVQVRFHEAESTVAPEREAVTDGSEPAALPAKALSSSPPREETSSRPATASGSAWVDVPSGVVAPRECYAGLSLSKTCSDAPSAPDARMAALAAPEVSSAPDARVASLPAPEAPYVQRAPRVVVASGPTGEWLVEDGSARIDIQHCGANLCGTVTSAKEKARMGERILRDMRPDGANRWKGTILDPRSGKIYQSTMTLKGSSLRVEGCIMGMLCGGETWTRG